MKDFLRGRLGGPWPLMVLAVLALWLLFTVMGSGGSDENSGETASDQESKPSEVTYEPGPVSVNRAIDVEVKSFRIEPDEDSSTGMKADLTLEIFNRSDGRADFRPAQLTLGPRGGAASSPSDDSAVPVVSVSPKFPVLAPVEFDVDATPGASYSLDYAGESIFTGRPR